MSLLKRFFAWIGSLMRGRHFIASTRTSPAAPPPPADPSDIPVILLALEEL